MSKTRFLTLIEPPRPLPSLSFHVSLTVLSDFQGRPNILRGFNVEGSDGRTKRYRPPFEEFEVDHCDLPEGTSTKFPAMAGPSLFVVTEGTGTISTTPFSSEKIRVGDVLFAPANTKFSIECTGKRLQLYRAGVNSKFLSTSLTEDEAAA